MGWGNEHSKRAAVKRGLAVAALLEAIAVVTIVVINGVQAGSSDARLAAGAIHHSSQHRARADRPRHRHSTAAYPKVESMERASSFLESRAGRTAFAVIDTRGHEYGLNIHDAFVSASTVKSMLLVAYLRVLAAQHGVIGATSQSLLYPMIHVSDNRAAEAVWHLVGNAGLEDVAKRAGMRDFTFGADWANEEISAADMARFFYRMDSLIPRQFRSYARELLTGIDPTQSWGIPTAARPRWQVFFKGGWRLTGVGQLVSQIARLEQPQRTIAIAVMTVADPSMAYGEETIAGVAARLLGAT
jgi:hypothetical protein